MCATCDIISPEINSWKNCRRHAIYPTGVIQEGVKNLLLWKRHTQRKLATSIGVLKTTVQCWIVGSTICVHCNSLEPVLTEENKVARLLMALPFRDPVDLTNYHDMLDQIHLDEKWFCLTQKKERYLLLPEERKPKRCIKHKSHKAKTLNQTQIPHKKVLFLCAVVCPRFNPSANSWWDGKLGIWRRELVKQKSKNRPRETLVWKNKVVTKEVYRELLISKLLLPIIEKCPKTDRLS